jgi:transcriptional regulator with XRE-family HTH domain
LLHKAIEAAFLKQPELAKAAGISYHALRQYRKGQRTPSPEVVRRIAKALREQGARLRKLAAELERLGGE